MGKIKNNALLVIVLALSLLLTSCGSALSSSTSQPASTTNSQALSVPLTETAANNPTSIESASYTAEILLANENTTINGSGATFQNDTVTINEGGSYSLSGSLSGQIIIEAPKTTDVLLVLNNVAISSKTNAAIYCKQANNLIITLADGSVNTVSDSLDFAYADTAAEEPDATIFSKVDLSINGSGNLNITANFYNGIGTKDDLVIDSGIFVIDAANHGIRGRDSLTINGGTFDITSQNDGIQSNNDSDISQGWIKINSGTFNIISFHDGVQAETSLDITGGNFNILSGGGHESSIIMDTATDSDSYKGLKAGGNISIVGGDFLVDSADDAIHSNQNITLANATFTLKSGDDGIHADGELAIDSGNVNIENSYEGVEASVMNLNGGDIRIVSTDDGINVAGGTDDAETVTTDTPPNRFSGDSFSNSNRWLYINGGTINVIAEGDGIDVNGNTKISGGTVYVSGPTRSGNGALDYDGTFDITGGALIAADLGGMSLTPSDSSTQASILISFSSLQTAGTEISLKDSSGSVISTYSPEKQFQTILFSCQDIQLNNTYTLFSNNKELSTITPSSLNTTVSETGETIVLQGFGGGGFGNRTPPNQPAL